MITGKKKEEVEKGIQMKVEKARIVMFGTRVASPTLMETQRVDRYLYIGDTTIV